MSREVIFTAEAPKAVGTYSQAVKVGSTIYLSSQAPLLPATSEVVQGGIEEQIHQVFKNLKAVSAASGGALSDIVKVTVYMTDLTNFPLLNSIMSQYFSQPYPARATVGVAALPKGTQVGIEAIMVLNDK